MTLADEGVRGVRAEQVSEGDTSRMRRHIGSNLLTVIAGCTAVMAETITPS